MGKFIPGWIGLIPPKPPIWPNWFWSNGLFIPQFIIDGMNIGGVYYHPTFLYESLWNIVGFIILLFVRKRPYLKQVSYLDYIVCGIHLEDSLLKEWDKIV